MHVAIIMDGNGRWATRRGLPRTAGHVEGAKAVRTTVEAAARSGVETLTLYAFSAANWDRPRGEVDGLMFLLRRYLFTGNATLRGPIDSSERHRPPRSSRQEPPANHRTKRADERRRHTHASAHRRRLLLSAQHHLRRCAARVAQRSSQRESSSASSTQANHSALPASEVDLLIRTGGEKRLSDFLLWECAYAELHFTDCLWPDFDERQFQSALEEYAGRARRFGKVNSETC